MFRLYFRIFWNKDAVVHGEGKGEGGLAIMLPLVLLAMGAAAAGFIPFGHFVSSDGSKLDTHIDIMFSVTPVLLSLAGIGIATYLFLKQNQRPGAYANKLGGAYRAAYHKFYIDEVYIFITQKIIFNLIGKPAAWFDKYVVDGLVNATGNNTQKISEKIKRFQSGKVQQYAIYFLSGVIGLALLFIYWWK